MEAMMKLYAGLFIAALGFLAWAEIAHALLGATFDMP